MSKEPHGCMWVILFVIGLPLYLMCFNPWLFFLVVLPIVTLLIVGFIVLFKNSK